jgi:predicted permease
MDTLFQNLRFGLRILRRNPLIALSITLVLGIGIGVNSAIFSIVDGVLLHAVRYPEPQKLVFAWSLDAQGGVNDVSPADFVDWRAQSKSLSDLAGWMPTSFVVNGGERPRQMGGARVTANFFRTLGIKPLLGRAFLPDEDGLEHPENATKSVFVSYRLWQEELGADPNVLGRTLRVDSVPYTVIGVAPADFQFLWRPHDLWIPVSLNVHERDYRDLVVFGRLGGTREAASAEMSVIARSLAATYPKSDKGWTIRIDDFQEWFLNRTFRIRLLLLFGAVGMVLLIACANVASLLLARSAARQREIAVRVSLGATRSHVISQLITESAMLAFAGGGLGLAIAWSLIRFAPKFVPPNSIPGGPVELTASVIWFTLGISALTCALFGLAPALTAASNDTLAVLQDSSRGTTAGTKRRQFRQIMVAGEVAVALVLLASTWLMVGEMRQLGKVDLGFEPKNTLTLRLYMPLLKYDASHALAFYRRALMALAAVPGVENATVGSSLPLYGTSMTYVSFDLEGSPRDESELPLVGYAAVDSGYFHTLGIPLERGHLFTPADDERAPLVAILDRTMAARYFPDQDPIGKRIMINRPVRSHGEERVSLQVVGVVGKVKLTDLSSDSKPVVYVPLPQNPFPRTVWFAAHTNIDPLTLGSAVRREFMNIDRDQPVEQVGSMEQIVASQFAQPRFQTGLMSSFSLMALFLTALGIYGVNSYAVQQRRNEIGVRMALGASRGHVIRGILAQGMRPTAIGIAIGLAGAEAMATGLKTVLVGAGAHDPLAFLGASLLLAIVAAGACYIPARKATRIDPAIALRAD